MTLKREGDSSDRSATSAEPLDQYELFARHYDLWLEGYDEDLRFYDGIVDGGRVLVPMCGTGRIVNYLAKNGAMVTGIDRSQAMLDICSVKLEREDEELLQHIDLVQGDVRDPMIIEGGYDSVIVPHNAFLHLLSHEEQTVTLDNLIEHLAPGGRLVMSVFNPEPSRGNGAMLHLGTKVNAKGEVVSRFESQDTDRARQRMTVHHFYDVSRQDGALRRVTARFEIVYLTLLDLENLMKGCGLEIVGLYGDYSGSPFRPCSDAMVVVARRN